MQAILTSLSNPQWIDENHSAIYCEITTSQFGDEVLPFTAAPHDVEAHGRAIFADLVAGKYGPIAEYVYVELPIPDGALGQQPTVEGAQTL